MNLKSLEVPDHELMRENPNSEDLTAAMALVSFNPDSNSCIDLNRNEKEFLQIILISESHAIIQCRDGNTISKTENEMPNDDAMWIGNLYAEGKREWDAGLKLSKIEAEESTSWLNRLLSSLKGN